MKINAHTRISDLLKKNNASINAIALLAKPLEKLKNPLLRRVMASRVTIAEAAKIGSCEIEDFAQVLEPLGFQFENIKETEPLSAVQEPKWLSQLSNHQIVFFDVRDMLLNGDDPLKQIIQKFKKLEPGNALCIINSFIPTPLIHVLAKDKVDTYTERLSETEYHTFFLKSASLGNQSVMKEEEKERVFMDEEMQFNELYKRFSDIEEIDVRHLEMPGPMETILHKLNGLKEKQALYVHHKRIPLYLLEELAESNFEIHIRNITDHDVKLLIFKV